MSDKEGYIPPEARTELRDRYSGAPQELVDTFARVNTEFPQALTDIPMTIEMLAAIIDNNIDITDLDSTNLDDNQCAQLLEQVKQAHAAFNIDVGMKPEEEAMMSKRLRDAWSVFVVRMQAYVRELYEDSPTFKKMAKDVTHDDTVDAMLGAKDHKAFLASEEARSFLEEIRDVVQVLQDILASSEIKKYAANYRLELSKGTSVREAKGNPRELREMMLKKLKETLETRYPDKQFSLSELSGLVQYVP